MEYNNILIFLVNTGGILNYEKGILNYEKGILKT